MVNLLKVRDLELLDSSDVQQNNISYSNGKGGGCHLFDGFALAIQFLLGTLAMASLLLKRYHEHPRRAPLIWFFDVSKQAMGASFIHLLNIGVSTLSGGQTSPTNNPCVWYLLNLLLDTTLGVGVLYVVLNVLHNILAKLGFSELVASGQYGKPPRVSIWLGQFFVFLLGLILMKILVVIILTMFPSIVELGHLLLSPLERMGDTRYQIIVVMLLVPLVMNVVQFWLTDQIIKAEVIFPYRQAGPPDWQSTDPLLSEENSRSGSPTTGSFRLSLEQTGFENSDETLVLQNPYYHAIDEADLGNALLELKSKTGGANSVSSASYLGSSSTTLH